MHVFVMQGQFPLQKSGSVLMNISLCKKSPGLEKLVGIEMAFWIIFGDEDEVLCIL